MFEKLKECVVHRMTIWLLVCVVMLAASFCPYVPQLMQVALYKGFLLFAAAHAGYWIDRTLFPYARPDQILSVLELEMLGDMQDIQDSHVLLDGDVVCGVSSTRNSPSFDMACIRRAIIVAAVLLCVALGV